MRTDFILSIEIVVIALETVIGESLVLQILVVSLIALLATVGVYGVVALLVRMDDAGMHLIARARETQGMFARPLRLVGHMLVRALPKVVRVLGFVGTLAMLLVGGGMYVHNITWIRDGMHALPTLLSDLVVGLVVGALVFGVVHLLRRMRPVSSGSD